MNIEQQRKLRNERDSGSSQVQTLRAHQCVCVFACDPLALPACFAFIPCAISHNPELRERHWSERREQVGA